jgi:hypothetical protein
LKGLTVRRLYKSFGVKGLTRNTKASHLRIFNLMPVQIVTEHHITTPVTKLPVTRKESDQNTNSALATHVQGVWSACVLCITFGYHGTEEYVCVTSSFRYGVNEFFVVLGLCAA